MERGILDVCPFVKIAIEIAVGIECTKGNRKKHVVYGRKAATPVQIAIAISGGKGG